MWSRLLAIGLMACLLTVSQAYAETAQYNEQFLQNGATADVSGTAIAVDRYTAVAIDVTIAGTATVSFQASVLGAVATSVLCTSISDGVQSTTTTVSGAYQCNVSGFKAFRAPISGCAGCTVTVYVRATSAVLGRGGSGGATQGLGPNFALVGGELISGATEAKPLKIRGSGGQSTSGWNIYQHSNGTPTIKCVIADVEGDCNVVVALNANKLYQIKDSSGNIIFQVDGATGGVTGEVVWDLDLVAVNPADGVASHVWNKDPLSTACTPLAVAGTNRTTGYCTFTDADGDQGVQISKALPTRWLGVLDADVWWKTTGTGNARFQFQTKCYADDEADDVAFNTASVVTAAAGTSARPNKQTISAITVTGCAAGELLRIRFYRNRTEGSDTLNAALDVEKVVFRSR